MRASSISRSSAVWRRAATVTLVFTAAPLAALAEAAESASQRDADVQPEAVLAVNAVQSADALSRIESVTVTARRREESAQRVPIPIATLAGAALEHAGEFRLEDLNRRLPSTNVQFGNPRQSSIAVRGLGNNPANDALEASVGVYLDNVYLGRPGMANLDLIDIDQVSLLRGPQGTLFGKNTTAGVLNITTRQPTSSRVRSSNHPLAIATTIRFAAPFPGHSTARPWRGVFRWRKPPRAATFMT
jgi:iron complex outermembrane receptor protein